MPSNFDHSTVMEETDGYASPLAGMARMRAEVAHHSVLLFITTCYCVVVTYYLSSHGLLRLRQFDEYLAAMFVPVLAMAMFRLFGETAYHTIHVRPFKWDGLWQGIRCSELFSSERAMAAAIPILLMPIFSSFFTAFKLSILDISPVPWDPTLMRLDQILHGGVSPWELMQPLLGHPLITSVISYLYNVWHAMWLIVYWQIFRVKDRELRMRFLISFMLTWILMGSIGAMAFASVGPCYYGLMIDGPNPFADQMSYLHAASEDYKNWSLVAQDYLWQLRTAEDPAKIGGGISAMPSLHVAVVVLIFLLARAYSRRMAWLAGAYVVVTMIGSVHLGWHYALDGYVAAAGAVSMWIVAGWLVRYAVPPAPESHESA